MQNIRIVRVKFKRNTLVFFKKVDTDQATDFLRNRHAGKLDHLKSELCLKRPGNHFFGDEAILYKNFTDLFAGSFLQFQCFFQFFFGKNVLPDEQITKPHSLSS